MSHQVYESSIHYLEFLVGLFGILVHGNDLVDEPEKWGMDDGVRNLIQSPEITGIVHSLPEERHVDLLRNKVDVDAEVDEARGVPLQLRPRHVQRRQHLALGPTAARPLLPDSALVNVRFPFKFI